MNLFPKQLRGVFAGAGSDGLNEPQICKAILQQTGKVNPHVVYIGTATYDLQAPRLRQTAFFSQAGCKVTSLDVAIHKPPTNEMKQQIEEAEIIVVSGGNTLYAIDRWHQIELDILLREAMERGVVLTGGSAGAICWFDGGHSDSMDPDTYREAMLSASQQAGGDESSAAPEDPSEAKKWEYIRVPGLGFLPGLVCPHHDKVQSNGVLRADDFDQMMLRHPKERGICIDHWAALSVQKGEYEVISLEGREGSVGEGTFQRDRSGKPGVWIKRVIDGVVQASICPMKGKLEDILEATQQITEDPRIHECRQKNPLPFDK
eukprot:CAMPEP_0201480066 /NCGR_PEP_ID=MMETSP0151_2-20130828/4644_1 /ASSEMBLY_ACC=CAM_ASM_000257 /TAXON_ID=200890 /ORGANISM="Paramoeba atlantica, Strain 621/1 / CCAP 1560/9" /LENGTH=317 /DNA_ID=CAMNT_0047861817 /DNA_START=85 /DNA_END=1038 /DNA_ORIENTATION=-